MEDSSSEHASEGDAHIFINTSDSQHNTNYPIRVDEEYCDPNLSKMDKRW